MSLVEDICNAWAVDLTTNVAGLSEAIVHLMVPWDPEEMQASPGERHLSIWPDPTTVMSAVPLSSDAHELTFNFVLQVWEDASAEQERRMADVGADSDFVALWEAIWRRFYVSSNQFLAGTERTWFDTSAWGGGGSLVRYFQMSFHPIVTQGFNAAGSSAPVF